MSSMAGDASVAITVTGIREVLGEEAAPASISSTTLPRQDRREQARIPGARVGVEAEPLVVDLAAAR